MNPFSFKGRLRRSMYILIVILYTLFVFFYMAIFTTEFGQKAYNTKGIFPGIMILFFFIWILTSSSVKRIHDMGYSGWWQILVCAFPFLIFGLMIIKGQDGSNGYGKNPRNTKRLGTIMLQRTIQFLFYILTSVIVMVILYFCLAYILVWFRNHNKFWVIVLTIFFSSVLPYLCTMFSSVFLTVLSYISPYKWVGAISNSIIALLGGIIVDYGFWSREQVSSGWGIFVAIAITWLILLSTFSIIMGSMDGLLFLSRFNKSKSFNFQQ